MDRTQRGTAGVSVARLALEAGILVVAYLAYQVVRALVSSSPQSAFSHAGVIIRLEQRLGIFVEPTLQSLVVDHHWLVTFLNWVYVWGYLPVIGAAGLYLFVRHREFYARYRNAFLLSGALGLIVFATLPVAPPRMFPELGFVDTVHTHSTVYRQFHGSDLVNEFAAVPSFHFGWILLVGIAVVQTHRHLAMRAVGVLLPALMLVSIVLTANHYVVDAAAGALLVLAALFVVSHTERIAGSLSARRQDRHETRISASR